MSVTTTTTTTTMMMMSLICLICGAVGAGAMRRVLLVGVRLVRERAGRVMIM